MIFYFFFILVFPLALPELNAKTSNVEESFFIGNLGYSIFHYPREDTNKVARDDDKKKDKKNEEKPMSCKQFHATHDTPWIAIILNSDSGRLVCLGSIIDEKHILTAHRCVKNTDPSKFKILLGYYKAYWGRHSQVINVEKAHIHPHDLVILELKKLIVFSKTVRPIKLFDGNTTDAKGGGGNPSGSNPTGTRGGEGSPIVLNPPATPAPGRNTSTGPSPTNQTLSKNKGPSDLVPQSKNKSSTKSPESVKSPQQNPHFDNQSKVLKEESVDFDKSVVHFEDDFTGKTVELSRIARQENRADPQLARAKGDEKLVDEKVEKPFSDAFKDKDVLIVGFTVKSTDAIGEPISKPLYYRMRDDKIEDADGCKDHLDRPLLEDKDKDWKNRFYCIKGESKFCWGCLGGPILDPKTMNQIGVIGETKPTDFCETKEVKYLALRVDIFMKWIRGNSLYI